MLKKYLTYTTWVVLLSCSSCSADDLRSPLNENAVPSDSLFLSSFSFVNQAADTIYDPSGSLLPFYAKLSSLDSLRAYSADVYPSGIPYRVNIVHFGDSHVQAGFLTDIIMRHLHARFGNAGRGMIVPHKLGGSNEPRDYAIRSVSTTKSEWSVSRLVNVHPALPIGISGVAVQSSTADNRLQLCILHTEDTLDYGFNRVRVFHGKYAPIFEADDSLSAFLGASDVIYDFNTDIDLVATVDSLEIRTYADGHFAKGPIYGFSLENGRNGILYHALGVNGACYSHWGKQIDISQQSVALDPDLFILSMGSNEAVASNFNDTVFYLEIDRFVGALRAANPSASILLTSPAQAFKRSEPNANFDRVSNTLKRYARDEGVAFIDVYAITGGYGSARKWAEYGLMARDKIHYTEEGYRVQGLLIYNALNNGFIGYGRMAR